MKTLIKILFILLVAFNASAQVHIIVGGGGTTIYTNGFIATLTSSNNSVTLSASKAAQGTNWDLSVAGGGVTFPFVATTATNAWHDGLIAASTNDVLQAFLSSTNFSNTIGANDTNFARGVIGLASSNNVITASNNLVSYVKSNPLSAVTNNQVNVNFTNETVQTSLQVAGGKFGVNSDGSFFGANNQFIVNADSSFNAVNDAFQVNADGSFFSANGGFNVDSIGDVLTSGNISAANLNSSGNITGDTLYLTNNTKQIIAWDSLSKSNILLLITNVGNNEVIYIGGYDTSSNYTTISELAARDNSATNNAGNFVIGSDVFKSYGNTGTHSLGGGQILTSEKNYFTPLNSASTLVANFGLMLDNDGQLLLGNLSSLVDSTNLGLQQGWINLYGDTNNTPTNIPTIHFNNPQAVPANGNFTNSWHFDGTNDVYWDYAGVKHYLLAGGTFGNANVLTNDIRQSLITLTGNYVQPLSDLTMSTTNLTYWVNTGNGTNVTLTLTNNAALTNYPITVMNAPTISSNFNWVIITNYGNSFIDYANGNPTYYLSITNKYSGDPMILRQVSSTNWAMNTGYPRSKFDTNWQSDWSANTTALPSGVSVSSASLPSGIVISNSASSTMNATAGFSAAGTNAILSLAKSIIPNRFANEATTAGLPAYTYVAGVITETGLGALVVDGITAAANDVVLVKNEATAATNGLYDVTTAGSAGTAFVLTRDSNFNSPSNIQEGDVVYVDDGATQTNTLWILITPPPFTVGTTPLTFVQTGNSGGSGGGNASTNVAQYWPAAQQFTNTGNSFFGNGAGLTNLQVSGVNIQSNQWLYGSGSSIPEASSTVYVFAFGGAPFAASIGITATSLAPIEFPFPVTFNSMVFGEMNVPGTLYVTNSLMLVTNGVLDTAWSLQILSTGGTFAVVTDLVNQVTIPAYTRIWPVITNVTATTVSIRPYWTFGWHP